MIFGEINTDTSNSCNEINTRAPELYINPVWVREY